MSLSTEPELGNDAAHSAICGFPGSVQRPLKTAKMGVAHKTVCEAYAPNAVQLGNRLGELRFRHWSTSLADLTFNYVRFESEREIIIEDPDRPCFILMMALEGETIVSRAQAEELITPGDMLMLVPGVKYRSEMGERHAQISVKLPIDRFREMGIGFHHVYRAADVSEDGDARTLHNLFRNVLRDVSGNAANGASEKSGIHTAKWLRSTLQRSRFFHSSAQPQERVLPGYILRATRFIEQNLRNEISLESIALAAGVPVRTLHHGFGSFVGISPVRWLRLCRLEQARRDLENIKNRDDTITAVAHRYCMDHVGRFARAYAERFGESPSITRDRVRKFDAQYCNMAE